MTAVTQVSTNLCFDGDQGVYDHASEACSCDMRFSVYLPPQARDGFVPALFWLSGLTCTHANFTEKAGAQRMAAALGCAIIAPDTSPRGDDVADVADAYDLGKGAGFYVDATQAPWSSHYKMWSYVTEELPALIGAKFPVDMNRCGVFGHSMGGHGALTAHLRRPDLFKTCSAFAPIVAPSQVPWGEKAFSLYLGEDKSDWLHHDATALVAETDAQAEILIDQGEADQFLDEQLKPELFEQACAAAGRRLTLRRHAGYDHSYYFMASFIADHIRWHMERLS